MSIWEQIKSLIESEKFKISDHGFQEMYEDEIMLDDLLEGVKSAIVVEEYLFFPKGPCVLILFKLENGSPIHALWGIPKGFTFPAVLITCYRPSLDLWESDFLRRK